MLIEASHPAAVTYVPKGARKPRTAFVATRTPVRVRYVPAESTRAVHRLARPTPQRPGDLELVEHGGVLWKRLTAQTGSEAQPRRPLSPREWAAFATGSMREDDPVLPFLQREFARTPLVALPTSLEADPWWNRMSRRTQGVPLDPASVRRVEADGRDEAARSLAAWMEEEVRVTDGGILARYRPLAGFTGRFAGLSYVDEPLWEGPGRPPCRPSDHEAYLRLWEFGTPPDELLAKGFAEARAALSSFPDGDGDLRFLANELPSLALAFLDAQMRGTALTVGSERHERASATWSSLARLSARTATGGVAAEEARDVLREVRAAVRLACDEFLTHPDGATWIRLGRHLDMLTARAPAAIDDRDAEALEGLAVGGMR